ncbi:MAG TPA: CBS domain-containing protein [Nitrospiraceae bacterium]|jgi:CBS domain-containing protein
MKVKDIMNSPVQSCGPETNLGAAAMMMWDSDCGVLPVVNYEGTVVGMITDRDICMAAATKNRHPSEITVFETIAGQVYACAPGDDIHDAMKTMAKHQVRRLPVINDAGVLAGMLSLNDIVLHAGETKGGHASAISCEDVTQTLKAIDAHRILVGL